MRLFAAAYPPRDVAEELLERVRPHAGDARVVPVEQVHLTLQFIGEVDPRELEDVRESVRRSCAGIGPSQLTPHRLMTLPTRGPARLIAAEAEAEPPLLEIQSRLARRLAHRGRHRTGDRYLPHLTLCRFRTPTRRPALDEPISVDAFAVCDVHLVKSKLMPTGAVHETIETVGLE